MVIIAEKIFHRNLDEVAVMEVVKKKKGATGRVKNAPKDDEPKAAATDDIDMLVTLSESAKTYVGEMAINFNRSLQSVYNILSKGKLYPHKAVLVHELNGWEDKDSLSVFQNYLIGIRLIFFMWGYLKRMVYKDQLDNFKDIRSFALLAMASSFNI